MKARLKRSLVTLALIFAIAVLAVLSLLFPFQMDVSQNGDNTLSAATQKLLVSLPEKVELTAYIKKGQPLRLQIMQLLDRYRRHKADISLNFIDPAEQPEKARELEIGPEGAVIVAYQGNSEKLKFVDETTLSNALLHLAKAKQRWISFLSGHGERSPEGIANFDVGQFGKELARHNIRALTVNLANLGAIPDNSSLLVIAAPSVALLPGEIELIKRYIDTGGNLLLFTEPNTAHADVFLQQLGLRKLPGNIKDDSARLYGTDSADFVIAKNYPEHLITRGLKLISVYPVAAAFSHSDIDGFQSLPLLSIDKTSKIASQSQVFGLTLSRDLDPTKQQRIAVLGDSDFLSNTYLGNVGNLDVGLRIINWLLQDDSFIDIPAKAATDKSLQLPDYVVGLMGFGYLMVLPGGLMVTGLVIWLRRRGR
jgi:ABC-type uncharacterized transport system involved in gliding motility auxiliary subunit